jgi:DUF1680 family protein
MANTKTGSKLFCSKVMGRIYAVIALLATAGSPAMASDAPANVAVVATPSTSHHSGDTTVAALNDGNSPENSRERGPGSYGNWPRTGTEWVQYEWTQPIATKQVEVYWWMDGQGVGAPKSCRLLYWNGTEFVPVANANGYGVERNQFNVTAFDEVTTTKLRLEIVSDGSLSTGVLEWRVLDSGSSPAFPPTVEAGIDRVVILGGKTYLSGKVKSLKSTGTNAASLTWTKESGPSFTETVPAKLPVGLFVTVSLLLCGVVLAVGRLRATKGSRWPLAACGALLTALAVAGVALWPQMHATRVVVPGQAQFENANAAETTATFSVPGDYILKLTANQGTLSSSSTLKVKVDRPPPAERLDVVYTKRYTIDSPLWNARAKSLIVSWIPYCIDQCNRTNLTQGQGGIDNFVEAAKALRGEPHARHKGYVFANAWVHQTVESMCIALMVDPKGDAEIIAAQELMKKTLEDWIPKILGAQEPDGYLQTAYTLADRRRWRAKWAPENRADHEGYVMGYFIESAINHYTLTEGKDLRLYNAAKKLADCWVTNIGPGKKDWYDGHQEMEQALVRFGRFVNDMEGGGRGDEYVKLARFLLDSRRGGEEYDQSHQLPIKQYEAVGHAVRATYNYSAMADVAAETADRDYESAVMSLWDSMVNKKYYVTGGIGSGETSEGFGPNYSLRNEAYCEACSSCGLIFFQYKLNLAYHDAKYADLYEETMYNALLGSMDLAGKNFYYDNPLVDYRGRYPWHVCPCCVGNIPRTLLMIPTWTYLKSADGLYVNMFIGSRINVEKVAGTDVEMVQQTDYPWSGKISITVNPKQTKKFSVYVRIPNRDTSELYTPTPEVSGVKSFAVNGTAVTPKIEKGYAVVTREWKAGDKIELELPLAVQRITADERIVPNRGRVALRYGPLIYNVERADQADINQALGDAPLKPEWKGDLLGGVVALTGTWANGEPLVAIPNFARMNRLGQTATDDSPGNAGVTFAPGASVQGNTTPATNNASAQPSRRRNRADGPQSAVWIKAAN